MTLDTEYYGPWIASFRDGPCGDFHHERHVAVGPIRTDMYFMPRPGYEGQWIRVDHDGRRPDPPWPNQIHYRLAEILTNAGEENESVAYYVLAD